MPIAVKTAVPPIARLLAAVCALLATAMPSASEPDRRGGWQQYVNAQYGFTLSYPADVFVPQETPNQSAGQLWLSKDGRARLIASAGPNEAADGLEGYRRYVMTEVFSGARFDYAPVGKSWFVVSGTRAAEMFYERVTFFCGGRLILGWQLIYPTAERAIYDPIIEAIHRSYRPRQGDSVRCPAS